MNKQVIKGTLKTSALCLALCTTGSAIAQETQGCAGGEQTVAVQGKIFNNGQTMDSAFGTLGVVALKGDYPVGKMKCGIVLIAGRAPSGDHAQPIPGIHPFRLRHQDDRLRA